MDSALLNRKNTPIISLKDLNIIWRIVIKNWWILLGMPILAYLLSNLYTYRLTIVHKASTELLLKPDETYYKNNLVTDASFYNYNTYIDNSNEQRILRSYDLINEVVTQLKNKIEVSYFIVGKVKTTEQFVGMPFTVEVSSILASLYETGFLMRILNAQQYEITYKHEGESKKITGRFNEDLITTHFVIKITSNGYLQNTMQSSVQHMLYEFKVHSKEKLISDIQSNLSIENPEYTQILKITLNDILWERAVLILDTLNHVYSRSKLKSKYDLNDRTVEYIDRQLNDITLSLNSIEDTLQGFKERQSVIDLEWEKNDVFSKIAEFDKQRSVTDLELGALKDLENYIIQDKDPSFLPPSMYIFEKSGFMNRAVSELYEKQIELSRLSGNSTSDNPSVIDLKSTIKSTKQNLLTYIVNARNAALQRNKNIEKESNNYVLNAKRIPFKQRSIINIQRKSKVSEDLYNFLLEKKASTKIAKASIIPEVKLVESPRYSGIYSPDISKIEKQFVTSGFFIALLIVVIRYLFYTRIETVEQLKEITTLPLVGGLPYIKNLEEEGIVTNEIPNSRISEAFRNLRTNLKYINVDHDAKVFLVTSYSPGEGKTFTSVNLANILAKTGKTTALIELDLHRPRIFKRFGLQTQEKGITTFINGQHNLDDIITKTQIDNLFCLFSGPIPPNPSEYVLSEKMKELLAYVKSKFDYIIIDTPPAGILSDSLYLIQFTDSTLFVLNSKSTTKNIVQFINQISETNRIKNINLVLNGIRNSARRYYYKGYGYSYGYGYGYGYGKGDYSGYGGYGGYGDYGGYGGDSSKINKSN